jgi:hypothetical protein
MAGEEPTSFIVPQFPPSTRFVRVSSTVTSPGRNPNMDRKILAMLAPYDESRTLVYVANLGEIDYTRDAVSFYGVSVDETACFEVKSQAGNRGYLCRAVNGWNAGEQKPFEPPWVRPEFRRDATVGFSVTPEVLIAGKDTVRIHVTGIKTRAIDLLYTSNGKWMRPIRGYRLNDDQSSFVFVGSASERALLHYVGIRASGEGNNNRWFQIDTWVRIK